MLTDLATYKMSINLTDTSTDAWLGSLVQAADTIVKNFCKRALETAVYTEYRSGEGVQELHLYQRPVRFYLLSGNLAADSPVVTALASTSGLLVGMPVSVQTPPAGGGVAQLSPNSTIVSIDSGSQITLSANATTTATGVSIVAGFAAWLDQGGYSGQSVEGFPPAQQLILGRDMMVRVDSPDGSSHCGLVSRIGGGIAGGTVDWPWDWRRGTLTARLPPVWPRGVGNIKVQYAAGYGNGSQNLNGPTGVPYDLTNAANEIVSWLKLTLPLGAMLESETLGRYSYTLARFMPGEDPIIGSIRQTLSRYREVAL